MFSYHTHTLFCDGKASIDEFCRTAIEKGVTQLAFTSHAPVPFENGYSLSFDKLFVFRQAVMDAKQKYAGRLEVLLGLEADYIPGMTIDFAQWRKLILPDFIVGSVHFVKDDVTGMNWFIDGAPLNFETGLADIFRGDVQRAVCLYFNQVRMMVETQSPDIIGHIDKVKMNNRDRFFKTSEHWYRDELVKTFRCVREHGGVVEINSRGIYRGKYHECFPHTDGIRQCMELGIPLTLASDAHQPDELTHGFELSKQTAIDSGLQRIVVFNDGSWNEVNVSELL